MFGELQREFSEISLLQLICILIFILCLERERDINTVTSLNRSLRASGELGLMNGDDNSVSYSVWYSVCHECGLYLKVTQ